MRVLEAALLTALAVACVSFLVPARRPYLPLRFVPLAAAAVALLQIGIEGFRWQMTPAYLLSGTLAACAFPGVSRVLGRASSAQPRDRRWLRIVGLSVALAVWFFAAALPVLFPFLTLPEPSGPHAVGLMDRVLVDDARPESFTAAPDDRRTLSVRIWYPARKPPQGDPLSYGEHAREIGRILTRGTPLPPFVLDDRALIDSHSYRGAELAAQPRRFSVLVFSHAYWAGISQSSVLMEELASHGYVTVSVAHAHETPYSIDREGRIVAHDPLNPEFRARGVERVRAMPLEQRVTDAQGNEQLAALLEQIGRARPRMLESLRIWTADVRFVLDELERMNRSGFFADRLEMTRVGVLGHSFGGTTAGQVCLEDPRCAAGCNLDGLQIGPMLERNLARPFLFVHHDNPTAGNPLPNRLFFERSQADAYLLLVRGTRHLDFSDLTLFGRGSLMRLSGALGDLDGRRCLRIQSDYLLAFFDRYLKEEDNGLLDGPSPSYPEVGIQARTGDRS